MTRAVVILAMAALLAVPPMGPAASAELTAASPLVKECQSCHGPRGDSRNADVPRLNGQQRDYLATRLKAFLDPARKLTHGGRMMMWNRPIADGDVAELADYFSRQLPTPRAGYGTLADAGDAIFHHGAGPAIPACAACHGQNGQGLGAAPRIAGQHGAYLTSSLKSFMVKSRIGAPMNRHTWDMTLSQVWALSAYLSGD